MSMDVVIWATCALSLPQDLPSKELWKVDHFDGVASLVFPSPKMDWQLIFEEIEKSQSIPSQASKLLPKVSTGYILSLEPLGASKEGYTMLNKSIKAVVKKCGSVVVEGPEGFYVMNSSSES